jgi:hypothetical protein
VSKVGRPDRASTIEDAPDMGSKLARYVRHILTSLPCSVYREESIRTPGAAVIIAG